MAVVMLVEHVAAQLCPEVLAVEARRQLPEESPAYVAPAPGSERRALEIYFLDRDPRESWESLFADLGQTQSAAGLGEVAFAAGFIPTLPGTDRYVDEV